MKNIISIYLWSVGLIYFTLFLIIGLVFTYLFAQETYDPWIKKLLRLFFKIMHIKVMVEGNQKFDKNTAYDVIEKS